MRNTPTPSNVRATLHYITAAFSLLCTLIAAYGMAFALEVLLFPQDRPAIPYPNTLLVLSLWAVIGGCQFTVYNLRAGRLKSIGL